ncbi:MAG: E3 ubiquitin-protein ligase rbbp6 [Marteilia pararefringens]
MSLLRYKFSSAVNYEQLHFDGVCLAVGELKRLVHEQRGDNPDQVNCDLVVRDSHSNQIYQDSDYISKNSSVIIMRIPKLNSTSSSRVLINRHKRHQNKVLKNMIKENALPFNKNNLQANQHEEKVSEEEKLKNILFGASSSSISSAMTNSLTASTTNSYNSNSSNAAQELASLPTPGVNNVTTQKFMQGIPGDNYTCYRCGLKGHYINFCPKRDNNKIEVTNNPELVQHLQSIKYLKTNHGIPSSFMLKTDDPTVIGTRRLGDGTLGINIKDSFAILQGKKEQNPFANTQIDHISLTDGRIDSLSTQITNSSTLGAKQASITSAPPDELTCPLCFNLLNEAAVAPCCGHSYCDLCIKTHLLQSQNSSCPSCAKEIEVGSLIANIFLRNAVKKYKTTTDNAIYTDSTAYNTQYIDPNNIRGATSLSPTKCADTELLD